MLMVEHVHSRAIEERMRRSRTWKAPLLDRGHNGQVSPEGRYWRQNSPGQRSVLPGQRLANLFHSASLSIAPTAPAIMFHSFTSLLGFAFPIPYPSPLSRWDGIYLNWTQIRSLSVSFSYTTGATLHNPGPSYCLHQLPGINASSSFLALEKEETLVVAV